MDIADEAQRFEEMFLGRALARHAATARGGTASALQCEVCADEIPAARRVAIPGVQRCVHCQDQQERRAAFVRGIAE